MSRDLVDWARHVLAVEGIDGWRVGTQCVVRSRGCCHYPTRQIILPCDVGVGLTLHELAHIGSEPGHGLDWQARLSELIDRHTVEVWTFPGINMDRH